MPARLRARRRTPPALANVFCHVYLAVTAARRPGERPSVFLLASRFGIGGGAAETRAGQLIMRRRAEYFRVQCALTARTAKSVLLGFG